MKKAPRPVVVTCSRRSQRKPAQICETILDLANWPSFEGSGPVPGIREARYLARPAGLVGTRIGVINADGSSHVEEIVQATQGRSRSLRIGEFSAPASWLFSHFLEHWRFRSEGDATEVERTMELFPRHPLTRPLALVISRYLQRALEQQLRTLLGVSARITHAFR